MRQFLTVGFIEQFQGSIVLISTTMFYAHGMSESCQCFSTGINKFSVWVTIASFSVLDFLTCQVSGLFLDGADVHLALHCFGKCENCT